MHCSASCLHLGGAAAHSSAPSSRGEKRSHQVAWLLNNVKVGTTNVGTKFDNPDFFPLTAWGTTYQRTDAACGVVTKNDMQSAIWALIQCDLTGTAPCGGLSVSRCNVAALYKAAIDGGFAVLDG